MPVLSDWKKCYSERLMSARDALLKIRSGSRVFLSPGCGEPQHLLEELVKLGAEARRLNDVEIVHMLTVGSAPHAQKRYDRHFRHNSLFVGRGVRSAVSEGIADYTPIFLSEIPGLFRSGRMPLDAPLHRTRLELRRQHARFPPIAGNARVSGLFACSCLLRKRIVRGVVVTPEVSRFKFL